jgi:uncharacterized protein (TIGR00661 family)
MSKKILVAPLNWGIGHATRCVPIINQLLDSGFEPILASDGAALLYLQKEFPQLKTYQLPAYNIKYSKKSYLFKIKLLLQIPKIKKAIADEYQVVQQIVTKENIIGIISDNRFGVRSDKVKSVYITHQINVFSGVTTYFTSKIHQNIIQKFNKVWAPDNKEGFKLSGNLSKSNNFKITPKYIGVLSRFQNKSTPKNNYKYDVLVLLSGTEPQRSVLEEKLINQLKSYPKKVLFIRGKINLKTTLENTKNITFTNFLTQEKLQQSILECSLVIARSGYSTIMDMAVLQKKCFFIPTPNQTEQEYLAKNLETLKIAPFSKQKEFKINMLNQLDNYTGFTNKVANTDINFNIFKRL